MEDSGKKWRRNGGSIIAKVLGRTDASIIVDRAEGA